MFGSFLHPRPVGRRREVAELATRSMQRSFDPAVIIVPPRTDAAPSATSSPVAPQPAAPMHESAALTIRLLQSDDRAAWEPLARAYKAFYRAVVPSTDYDAAWARLQTGGPAFGAGAMLGGRLVGIAHYVFQPSTWSECVCYLQDLYVGEPARGRGAARALIDHVVAHARERGATRTFWLTRVDNAVARRLYDRVARFDGMIRYDHPMAPDGAHPGA
jgi:ribosomal protein S18 acetylase RimI-like enzyme